MNTQNRYEMFQSKLYKLFNSVEISLSEIICKGLKYLKPYNNYLYNLVIILIIKGLAA